MDSKDILLVRFSTSVESSWTESFIELPTKINRRSSPGAYIEVNGTVTLVLDTCAFGDGDVGDKGCFTVIQSRDGCTMGHCNSWATIGNPNFLPIPKNCSLDPLDPFFACPCSVEHPTIWFDDPLQKWRMLIHQYPSKLINGRCVPQRSNYTYAGGYAETVGRSAAGPWLSNCSQLVPSCLQSSLV